MVWVLILPLAIGATPTPDDSNAGIQFFAWSPWIPAFAGMTTILLVIIEAI